MYDHVDFYHRFNDISVQKLGDSQIMQREVALMCTICLKSRGARLADTAAYNS